MYLKRIDLLGFKSFKEKTKFNFTPSVTAIVGPNGSGKSNIVDAIRWVLGEQNSKNLRGTKMEDIIFAGAQNNKPLGLASVSLVFDNKDKKLLLPYEDIIITRKLYRSGESEYQINNSTCRLKDITELFMDTGIGRDGYSIIGQGDIEQLLSNNYRRVVFEEATGINKYKTRKDTAVSKLSKEEDNLQRLKDIIYEIESSLPRLQLASQKAKQYLKINENLKQVKIQIFFKEDDNLKLEIEKITQNIKIIDNQINEDMEKREDKTREIQRIKNELESVSFKESDLKNQMVQNSLNINKKENSLSLLLEQIKNSSFNINRINKERDIKKDNEQKYEVEINQYLTKNVTLVNELKEKQLNLESLSSQLTQINQKIDKLENLQVKLEQLKYRLKFLQSYSSYNKTIQSIFKQKEIKQLKGILDTVSRLISVPKDLSIAINIALGSANNHIVTETEEDAKVAIQYLKTTKNGRATFLPISSIKSKTFNSNIPNSPHILGKAINLISYDKSIQNIVSSIIGDVIIVDTLANALEISKNTSLRIVTLQGDIINKLGSITGGSVNLNSKQNEITEIESQIQNVSQQCKNITNKATEPVHYIQLFKNEKEELNSSYTNLKIEINSINQQIQFNNKNLKILNENKQNYHKNEEIILQQLQSEKNEMNKKQTQIEETKNCIILLNSKLENLEKEVKLLVENKQNLNKLLYDMEIVDKDETKLLYDLQSERQRLNHKIEIALEKKKVIYNNLWEDYELTYNNAVKYIESFVIMEVSLDNLKKQEKNIKQQIRDLGHISIESIEEYENVNERWQFLSSQKNDIENTVQKLNQIIKELTKEMEVHFYKGINEINNNFDKVFKEMFGGGKASILISNDKDVLNSAIEITAQPPGKRLLNISLMSLGEKTLTAISLLFSILHNRPSPFLLLDEIEAPLDHNNNIKFANYIKNFSGIQFILITHKRVTMEACENIYGISMTNGISSTISVQI